MDPFNSSVPFRAKTGAFEYRLNMNCLNDTCTFYNSEKGKNHETIFKHAAPEMNFVGGWVPLISLMEWNCMRLLKSSMERLPLKMINHNIGVYEIGIRRIKNDSLIFGGPFLEYTKIRIDADGRIVTANGIGTPWNYYVTKHAAIDIDKLAERMAKTPGIGIPSPTETVSAAVHGSKIEVTYGRPLKRGRPIFGGIVPYDSVWRTGAGSPTLLTLGNDIRVQGTIIPKGKYSIYTIPGRNEWLLIFNTDLNRWPTDRNRKKDYAEVKIPVKRTEEITQQFTIRIEETKRGGVLKISWDDVLAYAEFEIKK
jgi:hypothetical protein